MKITTTALLAATIALPALIAPTAVADTVFIGGTGQSQTRPMSDNAVRHFTAPFSTDPGNTVVQVLYPSAPWDRPEASAPLAEKAIIAADYQTLRPVVAVGLSKGSQVLDEVQRRGTAPEGTQFVYIGDPNTRTGFQARFGLHRPNANTYDTTVVYGQYDGYSDWPDRFTFGLAEANAIMGIAYVHTQYGKGGEHDALTRLDEAEVTVEDNPNGTKTTTKIVPTRDLPLTRPIRDTLKTFKLGTDGLDKFDRELRKHIDRGYSRLDRTPATTPDNDTEEDRSTERKTGPREVKSADSEPRKADNPSNDNTDKEN